MSGWEGFSIRQAGMQAGRHVDRIGRQRERGKTGDKGVQFTARDELSFTVQRKASVIML